MVADLFLGGLPAVRAPRPGDRGHGGRGPGDLGRAAGTTEDPADPASGTRPTGDQTHERR